MKTPTSSLPFIQSGSLFLTLLFVFMVGVLGSLPVQADSPTHQSPPAEDPKEDDCDEGNNGEEHCEKCEKDEPENQEKCPTKGDPFNLRNGEFYLRKTFLGQGAASPSLHFTPYYSTFSDANGVLGYGWTFNLRMQLYESADGLIIVRKSNGKRYRYELSGGVYRLKDLPNTESITLQGSGSGLKYLLQTRSHDWFRFDSEGRLEALGNDGGEELRISYDATKMPVTAVPRTSNITSPMVVLRDWRINRVDSYRGGTATGIYLEFGYNSTTGHLSWVKDQAQRQIDLSYNSLGQLVTLEDEADNAYSFTYDPQQRMETFASPGCSNCVLTRNYYYSNTDNRIYRQTQGVDEKGTEMIVSYSGSYTEVTHRVKNASGTVIREWQERTTFQIDTYNRSRVSRVEIKRGNNNWNSLENNVTSYTYVPSGANQGKVATQTYPNGSVETNTFGTNGRLQSVSRTISSDVSLVTEYEYDTNLNQTKQTVYRSDASTVKFITKWTYDSANRRTSEKRMQADGSYVTRSTAYYTGGVHDGLVQKETDPCGNERMFEYTTTAPVGLLKREYDPTSPSYETLYTYDASGNRVSMVDALQRTTSWEYDGKNRMIREVRPDLSETVNSYMGANLVETKTGNSTAGWRITRYRYNGLNQRTKVLRVNDAGQEVTQLEYQYDSEGKVLKTINALNQATDYEYDNIGWQLKIKQPYDGSTTADTILVPDKAGRVVSQTNATGAVTETTYDLLDRVTSRTEAKNEPEQQTTEYSYDAEGHATETRIKNASGALVATTKYYYDRLGRQTGVNWNPANGSPDSGVAREYPRKMEYDNCGNMTAEIDALGRRTEYVYDTHDRRVRIKYPDRSAFTAAGADANDTIMEYDLVGNLVHTSDGRGIHRYVHYDVMNRPTHESIPTATALTGNWWATSANVLQQTGYNIWGQANATSNLAGGLTGTTYDAFGRLATQTDAAGLTLTYIYTALDQPLEVRYPALGTQPATKIQYAYNSNNGALLDSVTDRAGNSTSFRYDKLFRRIAQRTSLNQPSGPEQITTYDPFGRVKTLANEVGDTTTMGYDIFGQTLSVTFPDHTSGNPRIQSFNYDAYGKVLTQSGAGSYPAMYTYDAVGNTKTLTTQYGSSTTNQTTTWDYDSRNRILKKTYADTTFYEYTYDAMGNLATRKDARNQTTTYSYTAYGQIDTIDYPVDADVSFGYDASGRRTSMTDGTRSGGPSAEWAYDAANRLITYKQHPVDRQITYTYNAESSRSYMSVDKISTSGTAWNTDYSYEASGRLQTLTDSLVGSTAFTYVWDPKANLVKEIQMPGGLKQQKTYDALGRLAEIKALNSTGGTVNRYAYTYDTAGQRKDVTLADSSRIDYLYDMKRQLTSAQKTNDTNYAFSYTFDEIGNWKTGDVGRLAQTPESKTFTPNNLNQYNSITSSLNPSITPTYDPNGNMLTDGTRTYTWDQENRLKTVDGSTFTYDGLSRRVQTVDGGNTTRYLYDGLLPIAELDASNNITRSITRGLDLSNRMQVAGGIGGILSTTSYLLSAYQGSYFYDGNGNVVDVLDVTGVVIAHYQYDPFGNKVAESGSYASQPYQWSTKDWHQASGLVYYLYRFYNPSLGRWINRDPLNEITNFDSDYIYLNNNINKYDLFGLLGKWTEKCQCDLDKMMHNDPYSAGSIAASHLCCMNKLYPRYNYTLASRATIGISTAGSEEGDCCDDKVWITPTESKEHCCVGGSKEKKIPYHQKYYNHYPRSSLSACFVKEYGLPYEISEEMVLNIIEKLAKGGVKKVVIIYGGLDMVIDVRDAALVLMRCNSLACPK